MTARRFVPACPRLHERLPVGVVAAARAQSLPQSRQALDQVVLRRERGRRVVVAPLQAIAGEPPDDAAQAALGLLRAQVDVRGCERPGGGQNEPPNKPDGERSEDTRRGPHRIVVRTPRSDGQVETRRAATAQALSGLRFGGSETSSVPCATHTSLPSFVTSTCTTAVRFPRATTRESARTLPPRTGAR